MKLMEVMKNRYSCKNFSEQKLEEEKLHTILEAGRLAPTAKNLQEHHIYVLRSEDALAKFDKMSPCRYEAPIVLVVTYDKKNDFTYPGDKYHSGMEDATIVATHMILAATSEGVDSCWVNFFDPDKLAQELDLPENEIILMAMDLGYAAKGVGPLKNHNSRKDLCETVSYM